MKSNGLGKSNQSQNIPSSRRTSRNTLNVYVPKKRTSIAIPDFRFKSQFVSRSFIKTFILRPFVLGAVDGLITSFVILSGGFAGEVEKRSVVLIGFSSLVADAFSMGVSEFLSSRTQEKWKDAMLMGFACFISFMIFGSIPLLAFILASTQLSEQVASIIVFAFSLLIVGFFRAYIMETRLFQSMTEVFLLGTVAGGLAYGVASIRI